MWAVKLSVGNPRMVSLLGEGKRRWCPSVPCAQHKIRGQGETFLSIPATSAKLFQIHNSKKRQSVIYAKPSNSDQKRYKAKWNVSAIFLTRWKVCFRTSQFFRSRIGILIVIALGFSSGEANTPLSEENSFSYLQQLTDSGSFCQMGWQEESHSLNDWSKIPRYSCRMYMTCL